MNIYISPFSALYFAFLCDFYYYMWKGNRTSDPSEQVSLLCGILYFYISAVIVSIPLCPKLLTSGL